MARRYCWLIAASVILTMLVATSSVLAVPSLINYQGKLTDSGGNPLDGTFSMTFRLYNVQSGGSALWTEMQSVHVTEGIYSVQLGAEQALSQSLFAHDSLFLELVVGGETLSPRLRLTSTAFSMKAGDAETLAGMEPSELIASGHSHSHSFEDISGSAVDDQIPDSVTRDGELNEALAGKADTVHAHNGSDITNGTVADARIAGSIARDSEITWGNLSGIPADFFDGVDNDTTYTAGDGLVLDGTEFKVEVPLSLSGSAGSSVIKGTNSALSGTGVWGETTASSGSTQGVYGESASTEGIGVLGLGTATNGVTRGVYGESASTEGMGVFGYASASSGSTRGVYGRSNSTSGSGVYGEATASSGNNYGVSGISESTSGIGVYGEASATTNSPTIGVYGQSKSHYGNGVYGYASANSGPNYGVNGASASTEGIGVLGYAPAESGTNYGVKGQSDSTSGTGVWGYANAYSGTNYGVKGESNSTSGTGVYGHGFWGVRGMSSSLSGIGVYGEGFQGVYGRSESTSGHAVVGVASANNGETRGVYGESASTSGYGVYAEATASSGSTRGVWGQSNSTSGYGVLGYASANSGATRGVYGRSHSTSGTGVWGWASAASGTNYGVRGITDSSQGFAFYASGAGANYGPFTGAHEVMLSDTFPAEIRAGMIVSVTGEAQMRQNDDDSTNISSTLPTVRLSAAVQDKAVVGALVAEISLPDDHWYQEKEKKRFATVNALGEGRLWVSNINGDIEAGDYITTSSIAGYGQRQGDDLLHSYTVGKAIETVDWESATETVELNGKEYKVYLIAVVYTSG